MLKEQIIKELTESMKARDEMKVSTLRMLKAEIMKYEVSGADKVATDEIVIDLVKRGIKQRKDAIEGFEKGGNMTSADKEREEIKILEVYLPEQLSEQVLEEIIKKTIQDLGATGASDFGKVMGVVSKETKGKADGAVVSQMVKKLLS